MRYIYSLSHNRVDQDVYMHLKESLSSLVFNNVEGKISRVPRDLVVECNVSSAHFRLFLSLFDFHPFIVSSFSLPFLILFLSLLSSSFSFPFLSFFILFYCFPAFIFFSNTCLCRAYMIVIFLRTTRPIRQVYRVDKVLDKRLKYRMY